MKQFKKHEYVKAMTEAWGEQECILLYPNDMNLIVVDKARLEFSELKYTVVIDSKYFEHAYQFIKEVYNVVKYMYKELIDMPQVKYSCGQEEIDKHLEEEYEKAKDFLNSPNEFTDIF